MLFTIYSIGNQLVIWSGFGEWLKTPAIHTSNGGFLFSVFFMGAICFGAGYDLARAIYEEKLRKVEGRDY